MIAVLMGVSGSGKTTVGQALAVRLGWEFLDADDFHPPANREKMARGVPLDDTDREPWLDALAAVLRERRESGRSVVLACSALKETYRDRLRVGPDVRFVYLKGDFALLRRRLASRHGHYFGPDLLASQLATLEEPASALVVDAGEAPADIVRRIALELGKEA